MDIALITIFTTSFIIALSGAMMPGPLLTVTISESSKKGAMAGPLMIFGHGILELVLVIALISGLAPLLERSDVFIFIALTGGTVLLWMGVTTIRSLSTLSLTTQTIRQSSNNLIIQGIILSIINPYWLIWWASIGLGYIMHSVKYGLLGIIAFFLGHILADLSWYSLISLGIARGSHLLTDSLYRKIICGCALFLILFGCCFFYSGIQKALNIL